MTTESIHPASSGREFLARLSGEPVERLESNPAAVGRGLLALATEAVSLIRGYASEDPAVRDAAYRRWAELDAMLPKPDPAGPSPAPGLGHENRERLRVALTDVVAKLEALKAEVIRASPDDLGR